MIKEAWWTGMHKPGANGLDNTNLIEKQSKQNREIFGGNRKLHCAKFHL